MTIKDLSNYFYFRTLQDCLTVSSAVRSLALEGIPLSYRDCKTLAKVSACVVLINAISYYYAISLYNLLLLQ